MGSRLLRVELGESAEGAPGASEGAPDVSEPAVLQHGLPRVARAAAPPAVLDRPIPARGQRHHVVGMITGLPVGAAVNAGPVGGEDGPPPARMAPVVAALGRAAPRALIAPSTAWAPAGWRGDQRRPAARAGAQEPHRPCPVSGVYSICARTCGFTVRGSQNRGDCPSPSPLDTLSIDSWTGCPIIPLGGTPKVPRRIGQTLFPLGCPMSTP
jgi:hypothetical protein